MRYGICYKGSKSLIAMDILSILPPGDRFVDLFGGGAAMSHAAILSGNYKSVLYLDNNDMIVRLLQDAMDGKYNQSVFKPEWISREEFHKLKHIDPYVKYCWSFACNGRSYLFSDEMAEYKKPIFDLIVSDDMSFRRKQFFRISKHITDGKQNRIQSLEMLGRLDALSNLSKIRDIEIVCDDYTAYEYRDGDVVYCDIPYETGTSISIKCPDTYEKMFDHKAFYDWAISRDYPVWFSSYGDISDNRFYGIPVREVPIKGYRVHGSQVGRRIEYLWSNEKPSIMEGFYD